MIVAVSSDVVAGKHRLSCATLEEAKAAARSARALDPQHRTRGIWFVAGARAQGITVPDRYVVGLAYFGLERTTLDGVPCKWLVGSQP